MDALRDQFGVVDETRRARDMLKTLKQTKSVLEYICVFENTTMSIPTATDEELRHSFIFGLKPTVCTHVMLHQPNTLQYA
jgi:Retrotransposon gag protein